MKTIFKRSLAILLALLVICGSIIVSYASEVTNTEIVEYAKSIDRSIPYAKGGKSLSGFDCSGYVFYVFNHFGITATNNASAYYNSPSKYGTVVSETDALPGDVIAWEPWKNDDGTTTGHVAIYLGDGQCINMLSPSKGLCIINVTYYKNGKGVLNPPHKFIRMNRVDYGDSKTKHSQTHIVSNYQSENAGYISSYLGGYGVPLDGTNGNTDICVPGLSKDDNMVPQGMTYWRGENLLLISAYDADGKEPSVIYGIDFASGEMRCEYELYTQDGQPITAHVGGLALSWTNLYIANGNYISYVSMENIPVDKKGTIELKIEGSKSLSGSSMLGDAPVSYLSFGEGIIWAGNFYHPSGSFKKSASSSYNSRMVGFIADWSDEWGTFSSSNPDYIINIDNDIQDIQCALVSDSLLYIVTSYGRNNDSSLYVGNINILKSKETTVEADNLTKYTNLPMAEGIFVDNGYLYSLYESGAYCYRNGDGEGYSKFPTDVIWRTEIDEIFKRTSSDELFAQIVRGIAGAILTIEEKILLIHDRIVSYMIYDNGTRYTAFGYGVCSSYADLFNEIANKIGIQCSYEIGYPHVRKSTVGCQQDNTENPDEDNDVNCETANKVGGSADTLHAWNSVTINDKEYVVDCTWDDDSYIGGVFHNCLLCSDYAHSFDYYMCEDLEYANQVPEYLSNNYDESQDTSEYKDMYWRNSSTEFQLLNGKLYYLDNHTSQIKERSGNSEEIIASLSYYTEWWGYLHNGNLKSHHGYLCSDENFLYYSNRRNIYQYDVTTGTQSIVYSIQGDNYIVGFTYMDGSFYVDTSGNINDRSLTDLIQFSGTTYVYVNYVADNCTIVPEQQKFRSGEEITLSSIIPDTKYAFLGWSTDSNVERVDYYPGDLYRGNNSITLYAVCDETNLHLEKFKVHDDTLFGSDTKIDYKTSITYVANITCDEKYNKEDFSLAWFDADSGTKLAEGNTYSVNKVKEEFNFYIALVDENGNKVDGTESETITVALNSKFFNKVIAFFMELFGILPKETYDMDIEIRS